MSYFDRTELQQHGRRPLKATIYTLIAIFTLAILTVTTNAHAAADPQAYDDSYGQLFADDYAYSKSAIQVGEQVSDGKDMSKEEFDQWYDAEFNFTGDGTQTYYQKFQAISKTSGETLTEFAQREQVPSMDADGYVTWDSLFETYVNYGSPSQTLQDFTSSMVVKDYDAGNSAPNDPLAGNDEYSDDEAYSYYDPIEDAKSSVVRLRVTWTANRTLRNASDRKIDYRSVSSYMPCTASVVKVESNILTFLSAGNCGNDVEAGHALVRKEHQAAAGQSVAYSWLTPVVQVKIPGSPTWTPVHLLDSTNVNDSNLSLYRLTYNPELDTDNLFRELLPLDIADIEASIGEKVHSIGFPTETPISERTFNQSVVGDPEDQRIAAISPVAEVIGRNPYVGVNRMLLSTELTPAGMLGSPVVNSYGELTGVLAGTYTKGASSAIAVDLPDVRHFLAINDIIPSSEMVTLQDDVMNLENKLDDMTAANERQDGTIASLQNTSDDQWWAIALLCLALIALLAAIAYYLWDQSKKAAQKQEYYGYQQKEIDTLSRELRAAQTEIGQLSELHAGHTSNQQVHVTNPMFTKHNLGLLPSLLEDAIRQPVGTNVTQLRTTPAQDGTDDIVGTPPPKPALKDATDVDSHKDHRGDVTD